MDALTLARSQFAVTTVFHMIWALIGIGLSFFLVVMEAVWLRTGNEVYYRHTRFWSGIFVVAFGVGVASGIPLEFQFGLNWSKFAGQSGQIMGSILAFEATISFALEAAFLAIVIFGWGRVSRRVHMFSTAMVALGATLSGFWIMSANSWMQTPSGIVTQDGVISVVDHMKATFNPDFPIAFAHIWVASLESVVFMVGGVCAWYILKGRHTSFFLSLFKVLAVFGIILAPLQVVLGDQSGLEVVRNQPVKSAAMEANWETNPPGTAAPWVLFAWPDQAAARNEYEISIPYGLSILSARSLTGTVVGLKDFPSNDWPPVPVPFFAFRLMVLLGLIMVGLAVWTVWQWSRRRLQVENAGRNRLLLRLWVLAIPAGVAATELGWVTREVGRQPWIIYNVLRTSEGASNLGAGATVFSLAMFVVVYGVLLSAFLYFSIRILRKGPDMASPVPR